MTALNALRFGTRFGKIWGFLPLISFRGKNQRLGIRYSKASTCIDANMYVVCKSLKNVG